MAMGNAHRAVGTSNDTLVLNPAGLTSAARYSIDLAYAHGFEDLPSHYHLSVVDSKSTPVAGGLGYTVSRQNGDTNHRVYLGSAYQVAPMLSMGSTLKYVHGIYTDPTGEKITRDFFTTDLGFIFKPGSAFALGITLHNIVRSHDNPLSTYRMGFATSLTLGPVLFAADVVANGFDFKSKDMTYHGGIEVFLFGLLAIRGGYIGAWLPQQHNILEISFQNKITGGVAFVNEIGAIDMAYQQSINGNLTRELIATIKFFL